MTHSNRSNPYSPDDWPELLEDYVLGYLSADETDALERQLAQNPELAAEVAALQESLSLLPYALSAEEPSAAGLDNLLRAAQTQASRPLPLPRDESSTSNASESNVSETLIRPVRWGRIIGSIAALILVALSVDNYRLRQQTQTTAQVRQELEQNQAELEQLRRQVQEMSTVMASLQEPGARVHSLVGAGQASRANGYLVTIPGETQMVLVARNLPNLTEDQVYRLWAVAQEAAPPQYCGQFQQNAAGTAEWIAPTQGCSADPSQYLITLDAPDDPLDSAGPLMMRSDT